MDKLVKKKVIEEVQEGDVLCVNPMSVASNKEGKRRLVIDISKHINPRCIIILLDRTHYIMAFTSDFFVIFFYYTTELGSACYPSLQQRN